jgi:hypothetical protein
VLVAENRTEMGKKDEESAGGTTNSIDPLSKNIKWHIIRNPKTRSIFHISNIGSESDKNTPNIFLPAVRVINEKNGPF